jgi:hypothetical protein
MASRSGRGRMDPGAGGERDGPAYPDRVEALEGAGHSLAEGQ